MRDFIKDNDGENNIEMKKLSILDNNNKYYTPEIEEFHVGFEYESRNDIKKEWTLKTLEEGVIISAIKDKLSNVEVRVKYLDKEDIESLGFRYSPQIITKVDKDKNVHEDGILFYNNNNTSLAFYKNDKTVSIFKYKEFEAIVNSITIKNKSELKKLLKQLQIL